MFVEFENLHRYIIHQFGIFVDRYGGQFDRVDVFANQMYPFECLSSGCLKTIVFLEGTLTESTLKVIRHVVRRSS